MRRFGLASLGLCASLAAGCHFDLDFTDTSTGEEHQVEFSYAGDALFDCLFGCDLETPIVAGATSTVLIEDDRPDSSFSVRVPQDVQATYTETFTCERDHVDGSIESRDVLAQERCRQGENRTSFREVELVPSRAGVFTLEVLDGGDVFDSIEIEARTAATARVFSETDGSSLDRITLNPGRTVSVSAQLFDDAGVQLYFDGLDTFGWNAADTNILSVDSELLNLGPTTTVDLTAMQSGSTTLTFEALGLTEEIPVIVE